MIDLNIAFINIYASVMSLEILVAGSESDVSYGNRSFIFINTLYLTVYFDKKYTWTCPIPSLYLLFFISEQNVTI